MESSSSVAPSAHSEAPVSSSAISDLDSEVRFLNTRIVDMINSNTEIEDKLRTANRELIQMTDTKVDLEDQLRVTRQELDDARRAKILLEDQIEKDYVSRQEYDRVVELQKKAEKDAEGLHAEIEDLTGSLFNEANILVAEANKEKARLQMQLEERDVLLDNYKSQVSELKDIIQRLKDEEEMGEVNSNRRSLMSTPPPPPLPEGDDGYRPIGSAVSVASSLTGTTGDAGSSGDGHADSSIGTNGAGGTGTGSSDFGLSTGLSAMTLASVSGKPGAVTTGHHFGDDTDSPGAPDDAIYWSLNDKSALYSQIRPILRKDTPVFEDFKSFVNHTSSNPFAALTNNSHNHNQTSTASAYFHTPGGFPGSFPVNPRVTASSPTVPSTSSPKSGADSSPRSTVTSTATSTSTSTSTATTTTSTATSYVHINTAPLSSFKLYKRCLSEDIEPTLRLDLAPHISWYAKKGVMNSIVDGTAIVEPISGVNEGAAIRGQNRPVATVSPCSFCGEARDSSIVYLRMHNLRISKGQSHNTSTNTFTSSNSSSSSAVTTSTTTSTTTVSSGHPLCHYCLTRVRTVCDFTAFLRSVRDRVWKVDEEEGLNRAWDELARLRERMLWAREGAIFPPPMIFGPSLRTARTHTPIQSKESAPLDTEEKLEKPNQLDTPDSTNPSTDAKDEDASSVAVSADDEVYTSA
ncbi:guanine nucleotide exchange factor SEC2 [Sugiyamaella lignohabitans]|uniref:Guanine nucleotide exchange factor SEC2 n=1 Tax=Sugiyamaella lignohabitans TaxID=796027 RepID=A0A167F2R3_9ASCO|nr:guanine nucleotide exchange factor SEC2 [Sugiyamaella lignohabitans]ANB14752.1 guanine nucleotide exchange factor SEC2 [Sugiyamaella lignohabitans]